MLRKSDSTSSWLRPHCVDFESRERLSAAKGVPVVVAGSTLSKD